MIADPARFERAIARFDELNSADPHQEVVDGVSHPRELVYARRLTEKVLQLDPAASEPLRLAARCQHLRRWEIPRSDFPMDRPGYLKWRAQLKRFHAEQAGEALREAGYDTASIEQVQSLNLKQRPGADADAQTLEDALCLVFLEHQLTALADKTAEDKVINALRKSWAKMSPKGRAAALALEYPARETALIKAALEPAALVEADTKGGTPAG